MIMGELEQLLSLMVYCNILNWYIQDLIVNMHVMYQIKCFWYQFKAEILMFLMVQFTLQNIQLMQFYKTIELIYIYLIKFILKEGKKDKYF